MTKKTRTILFSICAILFLIIAPSVVLYSMGYRFDFDSQGIVRTGGIYFKVWPKSAKIYLNGKFRKKTNFLSGSVIIENLLPKKYKVEIKKEGFHPWEKDLEVEERKVTEIKNVFLIPENPTFNLLAKNVDYFWLSPDEKKMALKENDEDGWALKILELEKESVIPLFNEKKLRKKAESTIKILGLEFSPDSKQILLKTEEDKKENYFISQIETAPVNLIPLDFLGKDIKKVSFHPRTSQKIFFSTPSKLFEADLLKREKKQIWKDLIDYELSDRNLYLLSKNGFLFKTDFSGNIKERLNLQPFEFKNGAEYKIKLKGRAIFLLEDNNVYDLNEDLGKFEKIFEGVEDFEISPDFKKVSLYSAHEIWILFLEKILDQPQKEKGEELFLTRFSEKIKKVSWYTSNYLIFNTGNKIKIAEIDDRDIINIVDLAEFQNQEIYFNKRGKKLYVLENKDLFTTEKLLP